MAPNVPESYLKARQDQIINAAVACFSRKGFHQTTMKDICEEAGLSTGAVYNYFPSKEDIVARCAEMSLQRNVEMFASASGKGTVEAFKDVLQMLFSLVKQENITQAFSFDIELWAESTRNAKVRESLRKNEEGNLRVLTEMVIAGQKQGIFNPDVDSLAFARLLFSTFVGFEVQMASNPDMDIDAYKAVLESFIDGALVNKTNP